MQQFTPTGIVRILRKAETYKQLYIANYTNAVKPKAFTKEVKWTDWASSFENYLRAIPGRTGVPLSYVIRENNVANPDLNVDFFDDHILNVHYIGLII